MSTTSETQKPLTLTEASNYLSFSKSYLYKLTHKRVIPHFKPLGKKIYFLKEDLDKFFRRNPVASQEQIDQKATDYLVNSEGGN